MIAFRSNQERSNIVAEIQRLAKELGRAPGRNAFANLTGIGMHRWYGRYWARWSDALAEAGFSPNELQQKIDSSALLEKLARLTAQIGRLPTAAEMKLHRATKPDFPHPEIFRRHFGAAGGITRSLREFCEGKPDFEGVLTSLIEDAIELPSGAYRHGHVYLLRSGAHYKIGRSETLERRIKEISIALPEAVILEHTIATDDPPGIEAYWHRRFADRRLNGEWFKLSRDDVTAFRRRKFQ